MSWRLVIDPAARDDIAAARDWYDGQRAGLGDEFVDEVNAAVGRFRRQPLVHQPVVRTLRRAVVRRFPYLVIYRVEADTVTIVAVPLGHRDPAGWQARA